MCGIAGYVNYHQDVLLCGGALFDMSDSLSRRGPDDRGMWMEEHAALIHRRLAVVDIENGKQPMVRRCRKGEFVLTYNGELYNTEDIRGELLYKGYTFQGYSDTEVLLTAYMEWGGGCLSRLNGIFAFAVWDVRKKELFLARDRLGVKPLFYHVFDGGIVFASEIKTLLCHPLCQPVLGKEGIAELLLMGPGRTPGCGVLSGIEELKAGHCAVTGREGTEIARYWSIPAAEHFDSPEETAEYVRWLLEDSLRRQLVSDVPLCTFLSGGLDSGILSSLAARELAKRGQKLTTFSVDYADNDRYFRASRFQPDSDSVWAGRLSEYIGTDHHNVQLSTEGLVEALYDATLARDLPGMADVDSSLLLFCREVKKTTTVAISGECADEVFGGYPWFTDSDILFQDSFPWSSRPDHRYSFLNHGILTEREASDYVRTRYFGTVKEAPKTGGETLTDSRMKEMLYLNFTWFMQTLLDRKDRMSMYSGLEVRVPFCDHRIVEYVYNIPWEMKSADGREKGLLRRAAQGLLPDDVLWRKKSPYPKTHNPAYLRTVKELLSNLYAEPNEPLFDIVGRDRIRELLASEQDDTGATWYGQLMTLPQTMAYFIQLGYWLKKYRVSVRL